MITHLPATSNRTPRPVQHLGPCGERRPCWRATCREHWPAALTVETLRNHSVIAHCHGGEYTSATDFDFKVEMWRHGETSVTSA